MQEEIKDVDQKDLGQEQGTPGTGPSGMSSAGIPDGSDSQETAETSLPKAAIDMDYLQDVQVRVSVEIGRRKLPLNEILKLTPGDILDLEKELDEPLELLVNGTLIARGEVVVQKNKFGIRLVDICSSEERNKRAQF